MENITNDVKNLGAGKKMSKNIIYIVITIVAVGLLIFVALKFSKPVEPEGAALTTDQRTQILNQLEGAAKTATPLSPEEKAQLQTLLENSSKAAPTLSPEERQSVLNALPKNQ